VVNLEVVLQAVDQLFVGQLETVLYGVGFIFIGEVLWLQSAVDFLQNSKVFLVYLITLEQLLEELLRVSLSVHMVLVQAVVHCWCIHEHRSLMQSWRMHWNLIQESMGRVIILVEVSHIFVLWL